MGSAARGELQSSWVRWVISDTDVWHAYTRDYRPGDTEPSKVLPQCGRTIPRNRKGRASPPPTGAHVCQDCSVSVGFRRRPKQAVYMAKKFKVPKSDQATLTRLADIEARLDALEAKREE